MSLSVSILPGWSNLVICDLLSEVHRLNGHLSHVPPVIEDTGEVNWLLQDALRLEVPVPVIAQAVMVSAEGGVTVKVTPKPLAAGAGEWALM